MNRQMSCTFARRLSVSPNAFNNAAVVALYVYADWTIWRINLPGSPDVHPPFIRESTATVE